MERKGKKDGRLKVSQECRDMVMAGLVSMTTKAEISRAIAKRFGLKPTAADQRVKRIWQELAAEAHCDVRFTRHKIDLALRQIYTEARNDFDTTKIAEILKLLPEKDRWHALAKWDPYKAMTIALKAVKQMTELHGAAAAEKIEITNKVTDVDPLVFTPQERQKRIAELIVKRGLIKSAETAEVAVLRPKPEDLN